MSTQPDDLAASQAPVARAPNLKVRHAQAQQECIRLEQLSHALDIRLAQAQEELGELEGLGITSLVYLLLGKRAEMRDRAAEECQAFEQQQKECEHQLSHARSELEALAGQLPQAPDVEEAQVSFAARQGESTGVDGGAESPPGQTADELAAARQLAAALKTAMTLGDEAVRDLHGEQETAASLGKIKVTEVPVLLSSIMGSGRERAATDCADRARQSIERFCHKVAAVLESPALGPAAELTDFHVTLQEAAARLTGKQLQFPSVFQAENDTIEQQLISAGMYLEKHQQDVQRRIQELEARQHGSPQTA